MSEIWLLLFVVESVFFVIYIKSTQADIKYLLAVNKNLRKLIAGFGTDYDMIKDTFDLERIYRRVGESYVDVQEED